MIFFQYIHTITVVHADKLCITYYNHRLLSPPRWLPSGIWPPLRLSASPASAGANTELSPSAAADGPQPLLPKLAASELLRERTTQPSEAAARRADLFLSRLQRTTSNVP